MTSLVKRLPVLYLSHGGGPCFFMDGSQSPMFAEIDRKSAATQFLRSLGGQYGQGVKAILVVSAHWEASKPTVTYHRGPVGLTYDYYGFPEDTYAPHLTYPAPTDLGVADRVCDLLRAANIETAKDATRGFDHGVFIPMKLAFPEANVPIVQLSLQNGLDIATHMKIGEALAPLREEGVLIIGSGQTTHNLGAFGTPGCPEKWAMDFTEWVRRTLEDVGGTDLSAANRSMLNIMKEAPNASKCHPRIEHLVPLHVAFAAGAAPPSAQCSANGFSSKRIYSQMVLGTMSLDSYEFN